MAFITANAKNSVGRAKYLLENGLRVLNKLGYPQKAITAEKLLHLSFTDLHLIIECYVSSKQSGYVSMLLRSIIPQQILYNNIKHLSKSMQVVGVDVERDFMQHEFEKHNDRRELAMSEKVINYFYSGKNLIFTVGKLHLAGIVKCLESHNLLQNTLIFNLSSPETMELDIHNENIHHLWFENSTDALALAKISELVQPMEFVDHRSNGIFWSYMIPATISLSVIAAGCLYSKNKLR